MRKLDNMVSEAIDKFLLDESLSRRLYHFTTIERAFKIFHSNKMYCQSATAGYGSDDYSDRYRYYVCFTRIKSPKEGFGRGFATCSARIEFDGDLLNQRYKGGPVNYWGAGEGTNNKWSIMRKANGVSADDADKQGAYQYEIIQKYDIPQDAKIVDKSRARSVKFPTATSPDYIFCNGKYYHKTNEINSIEKSTSRAYKPIDKLPDGEEATHFDFMPKTYNVWYFSPKYIEVDGQYYELGDVLSSDIQGHSAFESEDRLFTNDYKIDNIRNYIKRIDILLSGNFKDENKHKNLYAMVYQMILRGRNKVFVYDNMEDFSLQSKNTINEQIVNKDNAWDDYKEASETWPSIGYRYRPIGLLLSIFSHTFDRNEKNKYIAREMKRLGLGDGIKEALKDVNNTWGNTIEHATELILEDMVNMSSDPTENGQIIINAIHNVLREHGYKSLGEMKKKEQKELERRCDRYAKYNDLDTQVKKTFHIFELNSKRYDITDPNQADFWFILGLDTKKQRYDFINDLISELDWNYGDEWLKKIRNGDKETFKKYLQHLAHHPAPFTDMMGMLRQLCNEKEILDNIGYHYETYDIESDYWNFSHEFIYPPYPIGVKDERSYEASDEYAFDVFKKS